MTTDINGDYRAAYTYGLEEIGVEDLMEVEGKPNNPLYYLQDAIGSVTAITNMNSEVIDSNRFAPYGEALDPVAKNARLTNSPYGFTGEMHDIEGDLVYLRARYYSPNMGRFIQQDTYMGEVEEPLSRNLYAYGNDNPLRYVDPSGHVGQAKYGETSANVKEIQKILISHAYWTDSSAGATGYFGKITKASLIKFQKGYMKLKDSELYKSDGSYVGVGPRTAVALTNLQNTKPKPTVPKPTVPNSNKGTSNGVNEELYNSNKIYKHEADLIAQINSINTDKFNRDINNFKKYMKKTKRLMKIYQRKLAYRQN